MTSKNKTWETLKSDYLRQVENALSSLKHPQIPEVLEDVRSHLDRRFIELTPDQQIQENYLRILDEMGPAEDYAELLAPNGNSSKKNQRQRFPRRRLFSTIFAIVAVPLLIILTLYLGYGIFARIPSPKTNKDVLIAIHQNPRVIQTSPQTLTNDVSPDLKEITVTFDQTMMDLSWSWVGGGETFPKTNGLPHYNDDRTTCTLPCELEPGKVYWIGINSPRFKNFQTELGVPAVPYAILFTTKDAEGRPTAIPENFIKEARRINLKH